MKVDKSKCIGCGACVSICPNIFELKDGKAIVISKEECSDSIDACPVGAISK